MKRLFLLFTTSVLTTLSHGQHMVYEENIRTLQVCLNDNPLLPPVLPLKGTSTLNISWDEMSHDYHRYIYRLQHCTYDWQETPDLFESDYLYGNNDLPVEDYHTSFNTTQLYTHYSLRFPNTDTAVLLSGNYKLLIFDEDNMEEGPAIEVRFQVIEEGMRLSMHVSSNTDIDYNDKHQQVSLDLNYGSIGVTNPQQQIHVVVTQNRRQSRTATNITPTIFKSNGLEWQHCRDLIFPAGNEYHKFEILDVNLSGMNVDCMRWSEPYYHAILWSNQVPINYLTNEDANGAFFPRNANQENNDIQSEYTYVHFTLQSPPLPQDVYVNGTWSNGELAEECRMQYNETYGCYDASILLKQGYYNYQYITADGATHSTMGDFWQTENEYQSFVYYRDYTDRYDKIVAYARVHTGF